MLTDQIVLPSERDEIGLKLELANDDCRRNYRNRNVLIIVIILNWVESIAELIIIRSEKHSTLKVTGLFSLCFDFVRFTRSGVM